VGSALGAGAAEARSSGKAVVGAGIKAVAVKSEGQQAVLALHRMRAQLVKFRTAQSNGLRGLLTEYGEVRAVLTHSKEPPEWAKRIAERRPRKVAIVALANKTARTWALSAHERAYQPGWYMSRPA